MSESKDNINFRSEDIKKKNLKFNVKPKKEKFSEKLKKLEKNPLLKGKNKYLSLGIVLVLIAAAITLPIVLPQLLKHAPEPTPEEQQDQNQQIVQGGSDIVNNFDAGSCEETQEAALADIDERIASLTDRYAQIFAIGSKANILQKCGDYSGALSLLEPLTEELRSGKKWSQLKDHYAFMASIHASAGDKTAAIEDYRAAITTIDDALADPDGPPFPIADRTVFENNIKSLENS